MSFSKTAIKTIKRMTKNQLIDMVIKISNYAEETNAKNIILLEMYKEIVDPTFKWENFTIEEQNKILAAGRSNNLLNTDKLRSLYPQVCDIKTAIRNTLLQMKTNLEN